MIVATAGHVDHGKTSLVKALTGIDTDRLKEEKLRGMSIEPGFAYADLGNGVPVGFVDVPGHERFVRNMLAAVAVVDVVLLVIAADDGPMPQTIEHLAILELLGIRQGAVVLTKIDRVSPARAAEAQAEVATLLARSALHDAPVFQVAAGEDSGMQVLRSYLAKLAGMSPPRAVHGNFRLAVDRCFSLDGTGLVVTGAVLSGTARLGDELLVSPQDVPVRVRGIHVHNRAGDAAHAGWRCALNLAGTELKRANIERGDWLVASAAHAPTERFDVRISVLAAQDKPLAHWTPVHLHIGAATVNARVAVLEGRAIEPGRTALAQLVTDRPVAVLHGDRFILRDQSARHTVAGGVVIDPFGPARGRSKPARLVQLAAMERPAPEAALEGLLDAQPDGVALDAFVTARNLTPEEIDTLLQRLPVVALGAGAEKLVITTARRQAMHEQLQAALREWHAAYPDGLGPTEAMLAARLDMRAMSPAWRAALKDLCEGGAVVREGVSLRLSGHRPQLSADDAALLAQVSGILREAGLRPPIVGELAKALEMDQPRLIDFLERASHLGHLVRVAKNRFFLPQTIGDLADIAAALSRESACAVFDAASYRDRSGIGRNLTIELLEFMDRARITRYAGGKRRVVD
jgi:selenocysteine-specific elongation factor